MTFNEIMTIIFKRVDNFDSKYEGISLSLVALASLLDILIEKSILNDRDIFRILGDE